MKFKQNHRKFPWLSDWKSDWAAHSRFGERGAKCVPDAALCKPEIVSQADFRRLKRSAYDMRVDRRVRDAGDALSFMIATGALAGAPLADIRELQALRLELLECAAEVTVLIHRKAPRSTATALAIGIAACAVTVAAAQAIGFGEPALGLGEGAVAAGLVLFAGTMSG